MTAQTRERKFARATIDAAIEPDGTFSGYASLFGQVDLDRDVVERGAFAKSLQARGAGAVRMLFQHDPAEPIGVWTELREDERGLFVRGRLDPGVQRAREVLSLLRGGGIDGLSIGFRTLRSRRGANGLRHVLEADLWEISVVTFPMQPLARVADVKQAMANRLRAVTRGMVGPSPRSRGEGGGSRMRGCAMLTGPAPLCPAGHLSP